MSFRDIPSVQLVLDALNATSDDPGYLRLRTHVRMLLDQVRRDVYAGHAVPPLAQLVAEVEHAAAAPEPASLRPVINATGVLLQTNLGRAPLSTAAQTALQQLSAGYCNVEYDLQTGARGSRSVHPRHLLQLLTGAEDALVVNNAAAALVLTLSALAQGREVVVSRGQAVEIGGGFRIPDVIRQSGCALVEVGTTNRTYVEDYAAALSAQSAALLRVHSSNFQVLGFVHEPALPDLVALAQQSELLLIDDLGSGALLDVSRWGLASEPLVQDSVAAGVDVVIFSGDKLLGGPQAGIIVGKSAPLQQLARHPLMRALRVDKLTLAALGATLQAYVHGTAHEEIPIWQMISAPVSKLAERAHLLHNALHNPLLAVELSEATVGGGSLPGATLPSVALTVDYAHPDALLQRLRQSNPPLLGRIKDGKVVLDLRTVLPFQEADLLAILRDVLPT